MFDSPRPAAAPPWANIRAEAYPAREWAGIIWAYLGPSVGPEHPQPELPQLEWTLLPDSHVQMVKYVQDCNWVQALEGDLDSSHISFLHRQLDNVTRIG